MALVRALTTAPIVRKADAGLATLWKRGLSWKPLEWCLEGLQTPVWFLRTRGLHLIKQGVLIPFLQRCSQSRKASESCSKADRALLHLHGLTEYLGTSADSTGMFQILENHPGIKIRCTCSMGLCKFLALAPHVMKGHVILTRFKDQRTTNILGCASLISHVWSQKSDSD